MKLPIPKMEIDDYWWGGAIDIDRFPKRNYLNLVLHGPQMSYKTHLLIFKFQIGGNF